MWPSLSGRTILEYESVTALFKCCEISSIDVTEQFISLEH